MLTVLTIVVCCLPLLQGAIAKSARAAGISSGLAEKYASDVVRSLPVAGKRIVLCVLSLYMLSQMCVQNTYRYMPSVNKREQNYNLEQS